MTWGCAGDAAGATRSMQKSKDLRLSASRSKKRGTHFNKVVGCVVELIELRELERTGVTMIKPGKVLTALFVSIFSLTALAADSGAPSAEKSESTKGEFEKLLNTYSAGLTSGNVDGVLELYSSDPVFMPEYAPPAVGREAVRKAYEWVFATLKLNGRFIVHEAEVIGDTAWVRTNSTGRFTIIATGFEADVANSEFFLFKRENGAWKIHRYIFTASAPPPKT
jgi:ketosteroid isomerase-like protein